MDNKAAAASPDLNRMNCQVEETDGQIIKNSSMTVYRAMATTPRIFSRPVK